MFEVWSRVLPQEGQLCFLFPTWISWRGGHMWVLRLEKGTEQVSSICTSLFVFNIQSWCICVSCVLFIKPPLTQVYTHSTPLGGTRGFIVFFSGFLRHFLFLSFEEYLFLVRFLCLVFCQCGNSLLPLKRRLMGKQLNSFWGGGAATLLSSNICF